MTDQTILNAVGRVNAALAGLTDEQQHKAMGVALGQCAGRCPVNGNAHLAIRRMSISAQGHIASVEAADHIKGRYAEIGVL